MHSNVLLSFISTLAPNVTKLVPYSYLYLGSFKELETFGAENVLQAPSCFIITSQLTVKLKCLGVSPDPWGSCLTHPSGLLCLPPHQLDFMGCPVQTLLSFDQHWPLPPCWEVCLQPLHSSLSSLGLVITFPDSSPGWLRPLPLHSAHSSHPLPLDHSLSAHRPLGLCCSAHSPGT